MNVATTRRALPGAGNSDTGFGARCLEAALVGLFSLLGAIVFTWPLTPRLGTHLPDLGDSQMMCYLQAWVTHALAVSPGQLFNLNMFFPAPGMLAASENMIGNQWLFAPVYLLSGNPVLANNLVLLASYVFCASAMYYLVREISGSIAAAAVSGFVFAFALARTAQMIHIHLLSLEWIPLLVLFLYRFLLRQRISDLALFAASLLMQFLCSLYLGYIALLVFFCYLAGIAISRRDLLGRGALLRLAAACFCALGAFSPVSLPYLRLKHYGAMDPGGLGRWTVGGSAEMLNSYFNVAYFPGHIYHRLLSRFARIMVPQENQLFFGFATLVLVVFGLQAAERIRHGKLVLPSASRSDPPFLTSLALPFLCGSMLTAALGYVLSLGPMLVINGTVFDIPLPFALLSRLVPGFANFRAPARFGLAVLFAIASLAGFGAAYCIRRLRFAKGAATAFTIVVLMLIGVESKGTPIPLVPVMVPPAVAPEYGWLAAQAHPSPVIELPLATTKCEMVTGDAERLFASIYHWQPMLNGYSGYCPSGYVDRLAWASALPAPSAVSALRAVGFRYVLLHSGELTEAGRARWNQLPPGLTPAAQFPDGAIVYQLR